MLEAHLTEQPLKLTNRRPARLVSVAWQGPVRPPPSLTCLRANKIRDSSKAFRAIPQDLACPPVRQQTSNYRHEFSLWVSRVR
ncbi:hypothetical protein K523DRAFT_322895 [Schizophyllum commune Tattone D]|nr:hypothetical protein K523DRAFT_322895 [Schizophyllum commune Tattone D]